MRLEGKVAIVTGGTQGIGQAISLRFASEGAKVAIANRNSERGKKTVEKINSQNGNAMNFVCDVSQKKSVFKMVDDVLSQFGTIDIVVGNAGMMINKPIEQYEENEWDSIIDINLKGNFLLAQAVVPIMKTKRNGKIIFISSIAGTHAFPNAIPYCSSKGGVHMLTKALSAEIAKDGINVNSISPGNTATPLNEHLQKDPEFVKLMESFTPTGRAYISAEEMSGAAVYLASDDSSAVHGHDLLVDDGWCSI